MSAADMKAIMQEADTTAAHILKRLKSHATLRVTYDEVVARVSAELVTARVNGIMQGQQMMKVLMIAELDKMPDAASPPPQEPGKP